MELQAFKKRFDPILSRRLSKKIVECRSCTNDPFILEMIRYANDLILSDGKRIRPYLAYLTYKAAGGKEDRKAMELFVALEIFHAFALVHDDVMDRGTERHGIPTAHVRTASRLRSLRRRGDLEHLGEAQAILLGDLLHAWANELVAGTPCHPVFCHMVEEVIIGQMIDVDVMTRAFVSTELIHDKMRLKTAGYTFVRPMEFGMRYATGSRNKKRETFCASYGLPLGIAFQTQDDLFDLTLTSEQLGKTSFSDLRDGQHTLFTQHIMEHGTPKQKKTLQTFMGASLGERDRPRVHALFEDSGAFEYGMGVMKASFAQAKNAITRAGLSRDASAPFFDLLAYIEARRL